MTRRTLLAASLAPSLTAAEPRFRVAVAGLAHGHARGFLRSLVSRRDAELTGISDPDTDLHKVYGDVFKLPANQFYRDVNELIAKTKPQVVCCFTATSDHLAVVKACAAAKVPVTMEKPLATTLEDARQIADAAKHAGIPVLVNYETTWYRSHAAQWREIRGNQAYGPIRKMVAMDGHQGPKEIGVGPEFLSWLTDPVKNGAGALFDFGCYGANLMTWMMDNRRPVTVTARAQTFKPQIYSRVDDEATILIEYPAAQGIIQASWNWPYSRKDFEIYAANGYAHAIGGGKLELRRPSAANGETLDPPQLDESDRDLISHLRAIVEQGRKPGPLSSIENNLIATEILVAARESVREGRTVKLS